MQDCWYSIIIFGNWPYYKIIYTPGTDQECKIVLKSREFSSEYFPSKCDSWYFYKLYFLLSFQAVQHHLLLIYL